MRENSILFFVFAVIGILFVILAIPLIKRRIPPNFVYGVRTRRTLSDTAVWYEVNRYFGKDFLVVGILIFVSSVVAGIFGSALNTEHLAIILSGVLILSLVFSVVRCVKNCRNIDLTDATKLPLTNRIDGEA
jgi:uncharacterized membrane protein